MKLILTESQIKRLKENLNETPSDKYVQVVRTDFNYHGLKYKGFEIDDIISNPIKIRYNIEIEHKRWGIAGITIYGLESSGEINTIIKYYGNSENDDWIETEINITIDFNKVSLVKLNSQHGQVHLGDTIEIHLRQSEEGGLTFDHGEIVCYV